MTRKDSMHPVINEQLADEVLRDKITAAADADQARQARRGNWGGQSWSTASAGRRAAWQAASPLLFDVALPVGLYYLLSGTGMADTPALIVSGLVPFTRSVLGMLRAGKPDYLAVMVAAVFVLSLALVAVTGSPKFVLAKESFGTALIGLWSLASAWTARPMTYYTARPILTRGRPAALACWSRLADNSAEFCAVQRRLAIFWGIGLLAEAAVRVGIVMRFSVHVAAGLVNAAAVVIIVILCLLSGPLGGVRLQRLLAAELAAGQLAGRAS
jgi:hypothetical protein